MEVHLALGTQRLLELETKVSVGRDCEDMSSPSI